MVSDSSFREEDPVAELVRCAMEECGLTSDEAALVLHVAKGNPAPTYVRAAGVTRATYLTLRKSIERKTGVRGDKSVERFVIQVLATALRGAHHDVATTFIRRSGG